VSPKHSWLLALLLAGGYQYLLSVGGLRTVVLHGTDAKDSRDGFLNANREGIFSCIGYLAIYFASVQLGKYFLAKRLVNNLSQFSLNCFPAFVIRSQ
jgi:phosphatidylinositol glycan class W